MKALAMRLMAFEEAGDLGKNPGTNPAIQVIDKLQLLVTRFSGSDGYLALMRRAVALSRIENSSAKSHTLSVDGSTKSLEGLSVDEGLLLITHLLHLMVTFIGQTLTLSLLADFWPMDK